MASLVASQEEHDDLFWAIRGGGGNFGVITSLEFQLHPIKDIYGGPIFFELSDAEKVLRFYREFIMDAPEEFGGFPGVYSSYVYKRLGCAGVLKLLEEARNRAARFETVFLLRTADDHEVFHGECRGSISDRERGSSGFGFDPIFVPEGGTKTFAEMTVTEKNAVSHRAKAVDALAEHLRAPKER